MLLLASTLVSSGCCKKKEEDDGFKKIADAFDKSFDAASAEYEGKKLSAQGVVELVDDIGGGRVFLTDDASNKTRARAICMGGGTGISKGDRVSIEGTVEKIHAPLGSVVAHPRVQLKPCTAKKVE